MNKKIVYLLTLAAVVFLGIMYIAREKEPEYALRLDESLTDAVKQGQVVSYPDVEKMMSQKNNSSFVFIDIRTPYDFVKGHLEKAVNIPYNSMFSEVNRKVFDKLQKEKVEVILYGNDQSQANAPCMLLRQMGYSNVHVLAGGYLAVTAPADSLGNKPLYNAEKARLDYAAEMKTKSNVGSTVAQKPVEKPKAKVTTTPLPAKKSEGGC